jgi:pimeloyl-ACP methyl ester carboxylesterase
MLRNGRFLDAYARTLDAAFPGRWRLVGHSTGGLVALQLACRYPERVQDILLVGSLFSGTISAAQSVQARLAALPGFGHIMANLVCRLGLSSPAQFQRWAASVQSVPAAAAMLPDEMRTELSRCSPLALRSMVNWVRDQSVQNCLPDVACPVTSIVGTRDPVVPPEHQIALLRSLPNASAQLIETGHLPFFEAPQRFDELFERWLIVPQLDRVLPHAALPASRR